jgi:hypothetical protein
MPKAYQFAAVTLLCLALVPVDGLHAAAFVGEVNAIVRRLESSGALRRLSLKYFRTDFATRASHFDVSRLGQKIT